LTLTDISEERSTSIINVKDYPEDVAEGSSKISFKLYHNLRLHIPEESNLMATAWRTSYLTIIILVG
jgi:hypothetical protein